MCIHSLQFHEPRNAMKLQLLQLCQFKKLCYQYFNHCWNPCFAAFSQGCLAHRKFRGDAHIVSLHFQWFGLGCGHPSIDSCWMAMGFLGWKYGTLLWMTRKQPPWIELDNMIGDLESEESSQILWVRCYFSLWFFRRLNECSSGVIDVGCSRSSIYRSSI